MKNLMVALLFVALPMIAQANTTVVQSKDKTGSLSRVADLVKLVNKDNINVNVVVQDLGGSTDVSPTQQVFLTLYVKGEMFNTGATFDLGPVWTFTSAKRISGGLYQVEVVAIEFENYTFVNRVMTIDARKAVTDIQKVRCDDFDCAAATRFKSAIKVTTQDTPVRY